MKDYLDQLVYQEKYGHLPSTRDELMDYLEHHLKLDFSKIEAEEERILSIPWEEINIEAMIVPKGTPRPRYSPVNHRFYVKGAKETKQYFMTILDYNRVICTRVRYSLVLYMPTPTSSMTNTEIYLAEKGVLRPLTTSDWDNLAKTYTDCLQDVLIMNDNIINPGSVEKYFSIRPRVEINIQYQRGFDSKYNQKKAENTKAFKTLAAKYKTYNEGIFVLD